MHEVSLAFFWHQHQPYYPDDVAGENPMPWVRLHGTKDYWGMAMLLREVPEMHATINLVPSLLQQLAAYTDGGHQDVHQRVSLTPADGLSEENSYYLMDNFFMVHPDQMIRPFPRYHELYRKRGLGVDSADKARKRFNKKDIIDLQCWSNLVWIHPLAFELDADLAEFRNKGRGWTEKEKLWLLEKQMELLRQVVPLHKELAQRGQIELTTTPFYHPIMPLLCDKRLARRAMPNVMLPSHLDGYPEDAREHIRRAVAFHEELFGQKPRGMWPSEGSVCQGIIPAIAEAGIQWIGADEEILSCSTDGWVARDGNGYLRNPEMLYRPWRAEEQGRSVQLIFRDHAMSDQIGFHYQRYEPEHAVNDFIGRLEAIGRATGGNAGHRPTLVSIILDGENCWEYYPNTGVDFLRGLYRRVVEHPRIKPVRVADYLARWPATDKIGQLFPGSWIQHNFGIWIGHPECNRAWDLLYETRQWLVAVAARKSKPAESIARAWEELFIAEGSDWFWWFGDSHQSCAGRPLRPALPQAPAKRLPGAGRATADGIVAPHPPRRPPRPGLHHADRAAEGQSRRPANLLQVDQRRPLRLRRLARHDEHGHAREHFGPLLRLRPGAVVGAARLARRPVPRAIGRRRRDPARIPPARRLRVTGHPSQPQGAVRAVLAAWRGDGRVTRRGRRRSVVRGGRHLPQPRPQNRRTGAFLRRIAQGQTAHRTHPPRRRDRNRRPFAGL